MSPRAKQKEAIPGSGTRAAAPKDRGVGDRATAAPLLDMVAKVRPSQGASRSGLLGAIAWRLAGCLLGLLRTPTAWHVEKEQGLGPEAFWTFLEALRRREEGSMDRALEEVQLSNALRALDSTNKALKALIKHRWGALPVEAACAPALLELAVLLRLGCNRRLLGCLRHSEPPRASDDSCEEFARRVVRTMVKCWESGKLASHDAYFHPAASTGIQTTAWVEVEEAGRGSSLDGGRGSAEQIRARMEQRLLDLAMGKGGWKNSGGPGALVGQPARDVARVVLAWQSPDVRCARVRKEGEESPLQALQPVKGYGGTGFEAQELILALESSLGLGCLFAAGESARGPGMAELLKEYAGLGGPLATPEDRLCALVASQDGSPWRGPRLEEPAVAFAVCEHRKYRNFHLRVEGDRKAAAPRMRERTVQLQAQGRIETLTASTRSVAALAASCSSRSGSGGSSSSSNTKSDLQRRLRRLLQEEEEEGGRYPWVLPASAATAPTPATSTAPTTAASRKRKAAHVESEAKRRAQAAAVSSRARQCGWRRRCAECGGPGLAYPSRATAEEGEARCCTICRAARRRPAPGEAEPATGGREE